MNMKELFKEKYKKFMKSVDRSTWNYIKRCAKDFNQTIEDVVFNNCITVYRDEIKDYSITYEPKQKGYVKEISSKRSGTQTTYKLTKKGIEWLSDFSER